MNKCVKNIRCLMCGEIGHFKEKCSLNPSNNLFCTHCKVYGHLVENCILSPSTPFCFLCGRIGHLDDNCSFSFSIYACSLCKKMGHLNGKCSFHHPPPSKIDNTQCDSCHSFGHIASRCSRAFFSAAAAREICLLCREKGHDFRFCPNPTHCLRCGQMDHRTDTCKGNVTCVGCGQKGHYIEICTSSLSLSPPVDFCTQCKKSGHLEQNCPEFHTGSSQYTVHGCYKCESHEHLASKCPERLQKKHLSFDEQLKKMNFTSLRELAEKNGIDIKMDSPRKEGKRCNKGKKELIDDLIKVLPPDHFTKI